MYKGGGTKRLSSALSILGKLCGSPGSQRCGPAAQAGRGFTFLNGSGERQVTKPDAHGEAALGGNMHM